MFLPAALPLLACLPAAAQAPATVPARIVAVIGVPGTPPGAPRYLNVTVETSGSPWTLVGCVATVPRACYRTHRVILDAAARTELRAHIAAIRAMPRCEPEGFAPGDPAYSLDTGQEEWTGHLPADPAQIPGRTRDPCAATTALAWWIVQRFGVPGLTEPG